MTPDPNANPLVSVIVIFLDGEKFIREAIDSVFSQTHRNWELLLVDDGSTDSSTQIARQYAESHPGRVRYLEHEGHQNRGMSATRNLGIRNAEGGLIGFLDCDDVWLPQKLERQVSILNLHPEAGMVFGASQYWHSWAEPEGAPGADSIPDLGVPKDTLFQPPDLLTLLYPLGEGTAPCPSDLLIRRRVFERAGGFQEEFRGIYSLYEDQAFLARVYRHEGVFVSGECWTRYRVHPDSCMSTVKGSGQYSAVRLFFLNYLDRYLAAEGVQDVRIWTLLRKALRPFGRSISIDTLPEADTRELKWQLRVTSGNQARLVFPPEDRDLIRVAISKAKTKDPWDIQLNQPTLAVKSRHSYGIVFRARADRPRAVNLGCAQAHDPWDGLGLYRTIELTAEWQAQSIEFVATADDQDARIHFDLGGDDASVELSSLTLHSLADGALIEPATAAGGLYPDERWAGAREAVPGEKAPAARKGAAPRFSVVIPTYQRRELVLQAVRAFARQDFGGEFEVIVVVDGSRDGSAEALRALDVPFPLTVLEQANQGAATARNRGASASQGEILLFLDDDMEAHPRLLAEHEHSHREGADAVLGHLPLHPKSPASFMSAGVKLWAEERGRRLSQPGADLTLQDLLTGQISVKREIFQKAAGFDTNFTLGGTFGNEDLDLGYRLLESGCRIDFNPYALSYQNYVVKPRQYLRQIRESGQADMVFARKHPDQAGEVFVPHLSGKLLRSEVWRALAALRPLSSPLTAALRSLALALVEHGVEGPKAVRLFYEVCEMEYWRGVHEAGGMPRSAAVRVLSYHAIRDLRGDTVLEPYGTPPDQFRGQMKALQRLGFHFITAEQFVRFLHEGDRLPSLPVLLTFDDCYEDLLEFAMPVLKELKIPAIAFAVSGLLGSTNTWDEAIGAPSLRLLDGNGLQFLAKNGVEIGAHSRTHRPLTEAAVPELEDEVVGSVQELEACGIGRPRMFAYPHGVSNLAVRRAVRNAGLQAAFTVDLGCARQGRDPYLIPRIEILRQDTGWKFLWKVIRAT